MLSMDKAEAPALAGLDLPTGAVVVVVGAYRGDTVRFITAHHPTAHIYAFEPQPWAYDELITSTVTKFAMNIALGDRDAEVPMYEFATDACSVMPLEHSRQTGKGLMQDSHKVLVDMLGINRIDLLFMNIEGYEYDLLPYLFTLPIVINRVMVQWHRLDKEAVSLLATRDMLTGRGFKGSALGGNWDLWERVSE